MIKISETIFWLITMILFLSYEYYVNRNKFADQIEQAFLWRIFGFFLYFFRRDRGFDGLWFLIKMACFFVMFRWLTTAVKLPFIAKPLFLLH